MSDLVVLVAHEFRRHRSLAERAIAVLDDERFFHRPAEQVSPIALIVKHIAGNLRARWSDPLGPHGGDGVPGVRRRDAEFVVEIGDTRDSLMAAWSASWSIVETTLAGLRADDLDRTVVIRGEPHTLGQALLRGVNHAAYHTGQILYVARMLQPEAPYLTIAPGASDGARGAYLVASAPRAPGAAGSQDPPGDRGGDAPRIERVLETALYVEDVPRAVAFYTSILGLRVMGEADRMASLDAGAATVLLLFRRGASTSGIATEGGRIPAHDGAGPLHLAFAIERDDLNTWREHFTLRGTSIESEVHWPRGGRSLYLRDPDGHSVELATPGVWSVR